MSKKVINISKDTSIEEVTSMLKNISTGVDIVFIYEDEVNVKNLKSYVSFPFVDVIKEAKELQELWKPRSADFVLGEFIGYIKLLDRIGEQASLERFDSDGELSGKYAWYDKEEMVWLPRQDQLQELMNVEGKSLNVIYDFNYEILYSYPDDIIEHEDIHLKTYYLQFDTMEQLWLAYIMKSKFNKLWKDSKWQ